MRDFHPLRMFTPKRTRDGFHTVPDPARQRGMAEPCPPRRRTKACAESIEVPSELRAGQGRVRGEQARAQARRLARSGTGVEPVPSALGSEHAQRVKVPHRRSFPPGN